MTSYYLPAHKRTQAKPITAEDIAALRQKEITDRREMARHFGLSYTQFCRRLSDSLALMRAFEGQQMQEVM